MNKFLQKRIVAALGITCLCVLGLFIWWFSGTMPANRHDHSFHTFVVTAGDSPREVANNLKQQGLIRDPVIFFLLLRKQRLDSKIQAGGFRLSPSQSAEEIARSLLSGSSLSDIKITIVEGKRADEIADLLATKLPQYNESWRAQLVAHEGYLFPDTYDFSPSTDIDQVISRLTSNFEQHYQTLPLGKTQLTKEQIVTIASILEREVKHSEDKPQVASVILNRLAIGMPLQLDTTVEYAKGKIGDSWWEPISQDDTQSVKSPYNTYLQPGLPPTPISNPGLDSLKAAANPAHTQYYYYITDKKGVTRYATTYEQHVANIKKYGLSS